MAVYERTYRAYTGPRTPERGRFLVLPRYAFREVFRSRAFAGFLIACCLWPLVLAILIYLPHNVSALKAFQAQAGEILSVFKYDASFFFNFYFRPQHFAAWILAFIVGPALISGDLRNNGLPLYLSRPFTRTEYVAGKMAVLVILLSAITWIPGLLLFLLQAYLGGMEWLRDHYRIGPAILLSSWIWIFLLCLVSLALSAYVKWKPAARAAMFAVFFALAILAQMLNVMLKTSWGSLLDISDMSYTVTTALFGIPSRVDVPAWAAAASLVAAGAICLGLLSRKLRAYEVVR